MIIILSKYKTNSVIMAKQKYSQQNIIVVNRYHKYLRIIITYSLLCSIEWRHNGVTI